MRDPPSDGPALDLLPARVTELGEGLAIRRALPTRGRRMVGAWCFLDHVGPLDYAAGRGMRVGPHPHIGLQTFTWMIEGELLHRDSLGCEQWIRPGQVNLMTAGAGIAHAEESPAAAGRVHAAQLWIALPESHRHGPSAFAHHPTLPRFALQGFEATLLVGQFDDLLSPVEVHSPLLGLDLLATRDATATLALRPDFEHAVLCLEGSAEIEGTALSTGALLWLGTQRSEARVRVPAGTRLLLLGGAPFGEDVLMWWNFVARRAEEIQRATDGWNAGRHFGTVPGTSLARVPAPDPARLNLRARGGN